MAGWAKKPCTVETVRNNLAKLKKQQKYMSHRENGADNAANRVHAEGVGVVALTGLLVQADPVLEHDTAVAQRRPNEAHHERTSVVDVASRRSDDNEASDSSRHRPNDCWRPGVEPLDEHPSEGAGSSGQVGDQHCHASTGT